MKIIKAEELWHERDQKYYLAVYVELEDGSKASMGKIPLCDTKEELLEYLESQRKVLENVARFDTERKERADLTDSSIETRLARLEATVEVLKLREARKMEGLDGTMDTS